MTLALLAVATVAGVLARRSRRPHPSPAEVDPAEVELQEMIAEERAREALGASRSPS
ncbi:MAG: hypothetical protein ACR2G3_02380 [Solirubrobacterales bacterium]